MAKNVLQRVRERVSDTLHVDEDQVNTTSEFAEDLGADSLDLVELVMEFEQEFDIEIPDDDAAKLKTVQQAVDYLEKRIQG